MVKLLLFVALVANIFLIVLATENDRCTEAHETYVECPDFLCNAKTCSELGYPQPCPIRGPDDKCPGKPACLCEDGYLRNSKGVCVPVKQCPSCGGDTNAQSGCGINCGRHCSNYDKGPVACPAICRVNACDCKSNYVFDDNIGKCVKPKDCTPVCKANEIYSNCTNGGCFGARSCSEIGKPERCVKLDPKNCKKGCLCKDGYLRNDDGTCVPQDECPKNPQNKCNQKANEVYVECPDSLCNPKTCSELGFPQPCTKPDPDDKCPGKPACLCVDGYVRNKKGVCIPQEECPSCGGDPNAQAGCGINCGRHCSDYDMGPVACKMICKVNSCDCKSDFVYDDNTGKCVLPENCTPVCGPYEVYSNCTNGGCFGPLYCSAKGQPERCIYLYDPKKCIKGCICRDGYLRNDDDTCVPEDQCPDTISCKGDPNAKPGCGVNCGRLCSNYDKADSVSCIKVCYEDGCDCKDGYVLDTNIGKCVRPKDCTPVCSDDEVYSSCVNGGCYGPRNCSEIGRPTICADPVKGGCIPGCLCKDDYLRNEDGVCVPQDQCPKKCYKPNEVYDECPATCPPQRCDVDPRLIKCKPGPYLGDPLCEPGCRCADGYLRNKDGDCVLKNECDSCKGDPNAKPGCGVNCGRLCSNYDKADSVACIDICYVDGCDCKDGYVLDTNIGKCVRPKDCTPVCSDDEVYSSCVNGGCYGPRNCSQIGGHTICVDPIKGGCIPGCLCKDDYLRNDDGVCVPQDECPSRSKKCNKPNEEYDSCIYSCPPQTCESIGQKYHCPLQTADNCKAGCKCKSGYYRNAVGGCISKKNCLKCTGPNEYYSCGGACDNVCATLSEQNQTNCPIINVKCNEMCYCKEGYARDEDNTCIPIKNCPKTTTTPCKKKTVAPIKDTTSAPQGSTTNLTEARQQFSLGLASFTAKFFKEMLLTTNDSFIFSAASVDIPLAELFLYSTGESKEQLKSVLNLDTNDEVRAVFSELLESFKSQENIEFSAAAKVYVNEEYPLSDAFLDDTADVFDATAENIDCSNSVQAADTMNQWVEEHTNNRIQDLVTPNMISTLTRLVLLNAMYFKGNWQYQFNPNNTQKRDFHVDKDTTIQVPTMYQKGKFKYVDSEDLNAKLLVLPYENNDFTCLVILPNDIEGLDQLAVDLMDVNRVNKAHDSMVNQTVKIWLPSMEIETSIDLADILKKLDVTLLFDPSKSGLDGILKDYESLYVSAFVQKALVKVNEQGSEAAAANAGVVGTRAIPGPPPMELEFNADHPFLFTIKKGNTMLFTGVFRK